MNNNKAKATKILLIAVVCAIGLIGMWKLAVSKQQILDAIEVIRSIGVLSIIVFYLLYAGLVSVSFPSTLFNVTAGMIFGLWSGLAVAILGGFTAAIIGFLLSRHFFHDFVGERIKRTEKGRDILTMVEQESPKFIAILRLNPFIPALLKSYGLGITNVKLSTYAWATLCGQIPLTVTYVIAGWVGGSQMLSEENGPSAIQYGVLILGVLVSIGLVFYTHHYFKTVSKRHATGSQ